MSRDTENQKKKKKERLGEKQMPKTGSLPELATVIFMKYGDLKPSETCETRTDICNVRNSNPTLRIVLRLYQI